MFDSCPSKIDHKILHFMDSLYFANIIGPGNDLKPLTKNLKLNLVFMPNSGQQEQFNFCF